MSASPLVPSAHALEMARDVLRIEAAAVQALAARLDDRFTRAVELLLALQGPRRRQRHRQERPHRAQDRRDPRLDGHARDLRARGGSGHGDLGMITRDDVLVALSYSGEGDELLTMLPVGEARRHAARSR